MNDCASAAGSSTDIGISISRVSVQGAVFLCSCSSSTVSLALFSLLGKTVIHEYVSADMRISFSFFPFFLPFPHIPPDRI